MTITTLALWTALFLLLEGFFSGSELALVSADKMKLTHKAAQGKRGAKMALILANRPAWFFSTTLLGQSLFIVANSIMITFFITQNFGDEYEYLGILLSPLVLIFGEAVPKTLFQHWADRITPKVAPIILFFSYLVSPVVWPLSRLTLLLMGGVESSLLTGHEVTRDSLELYLKESEETREVSSVFKRSLLKILSFTTKEAHDIMTPLIEVFSLRKTTSIEEAIAICQEEGYSSVPIFHKRAYHIVGIVSFQKLLMAKDVTKPVSTIMDDPNFVPPMMSVKDLFLLLRDTKTSFAVVVDEYGAAAGIVTLEDIVEEVLGEIQDEFDDERSGWKQVGHSQFLFSGRVHVTEINEKLHWSLPMGNYDTLAGFLLKQFGRFPQSGEVLHFGSLTFLIKTATSRSIEEVLVELEK